MQDASIVFQMGALLLIVYSILASAYYNDAARWSERVGLFDEDSEKQRATRNRKRAEDMFRWCSAFMAVAVVCAILPVYVPIRIAWVAAKWVLLLPFATLLYACLRYLARRYWVEI